MRILISAYACEPGKGSEPGIGWHWVLEAAALGHDVWVLTRANNREAIESSGQRRPNLHVEYVDLPRGLAVAKKRGPFLRLYYTAWQWAAYRRARDLHRQHRFDVVQHVTFGSFRDPSFMGRLGIPFVFGPVGGGERAPIRLRFDYGPRGHLLDAARDVATVAARFNPWLLGCFDAATLILVKTPHTGAVIPRRYRARVRHLIEIGAPTVPPAPPRDPERPLRLLYAGRFLYWKGMQYGLRAFARVLEDVPGIRLTIAGGGPEARRWQALCRALGIDHAVDWPGWVAHDDVGDVYRRHDAFLFPSLHDSSGSVVLEAMAHGLPVVCFDLGGPGVLVDRDSGIVVSTEGRSAAQLIAALAEGLRTVATDATRRRQLSEGALRRAGELTWRRPVAHLYDRPFAERPDGSSAAPWRYVPDDARLTSDDE